VISTFCRWTRRSGPEWTVERLKNLKLELINRASGGTYRVPCIARNKDGLPKGVWSYIFRKGLSSTKNLELMCNAIMVYSTLTSSVLTKKQEKKFFGSMMSPDKTGMESTLKYIPCSRIVRDFSPVPYVWCCTSEMKSAPTIFGRSIRQDDALGCLLSFSVNPTLSHWLKRYPDIMSQVVPYHLCLALEEASYNTSLHAKADPTASFAIGSIGQIQEPGYKLRAVANPNQVVQAALYPLKKVILDDLKGIGTDCTHDQEAGVLAIQGWLQEGKTCFSVDLSDATNLMPLPLQLDVLRNRYASLIERDSRWETSIKIFEEASRGPWYSKDSHGVKRVVRFTRGQPLGLGPSFATFALTHNILVEGICKRCGQDPRQTFRILGDDIVISNKEVHDIYRQTLRNLGCVVSVPKTMVSNQMAQFAGVTITPRLLIHQYDWKAITWNRLLPLARLYGPKIRDMVPKSKRRILDEIATIPEFWGGLGWNPKGVPLEIRLQTPACQAVGTMPLDSKEFETFVPLTSLLNKLYKQVEREELLKPDRFMESKLSRLDHLLSDKGRSVASSHGFLLQWDNPLVRLADRYTDRLRNLGLPVDDRITRECLATLTLSEDLIFSKMLIPQGLVESGDPRVEATKPVIVQLVEAIHRKEKGFSSLVDAILRDYNDRHRSKPAPHLKQVVDKLEGRTVPHQAPSKPGDKEPTTVRKSHPRLKDGGLSL
jgi:hypothetical protein